MDGQNKPKANKQRNQPSNQLTNRPTTKERHNPINEQTIDVLCRATSAECAAPAAPAAPSVVPPQPTPSPPTAEPPEEWTAFHLPVFLALADLATATNHGPHAHTRAHAYTHSHARKCARMHETLTRPRGLGALAGCAQQRYLLVTVLQKALLSMQPPAPPPHGEGAHGAGASIPCARYPKGFVCR